MKQSIEQEVDHSEKGEFPSVRLTHREIEYFADRNFQARVTEGAQRVAKSKAESGFVVGTLRDEQTVFPLMYGTAFADPFEDGIVISSLFGSNTSAEVDPIPHKNDINAVLKKREGRKFTSFDEELEYPVSIDASFHFHPDTSGFSETDIQSYDDLVHGARVLKRKEDYTFVTTSQYREGLFFPIFERTYLDKRLSGLGYIAISGMPSKTEYQGAKLSRLSAPQQVKLFQNCGFDVSYAVIPIKDGKLNFQSLTI